jgi:fructokinase
MPPGNLRIGIDLGGTKLEIAALARNGEMLLRERVPAPQGDYAATLKAISDLIALAEKKLGETASIGIAMPGALSRASGLVKNANSVWLNGQPFDRDLEELLGRKIRIANDADCFALSEAKDGAGAGHKTVFGVILGTGVGGGIVVSGSALSGPNAIAGEWGHNALPGPMDDERPGPICYCGRRGCIETFLSGPGLAADHAQRNGETLAAIDIAARAETGDPAASQTMARYYDRLARALAGVINLLDPDAIVLGGGVSNIAGLYREIPKRLSAYVFSDVCTTPVLRNHHGDSSGVRGAAWLWNDA